MDHEIAIKDLSDLSPVEAPKSEIGHLIEVAMQIDNFDMEKFEKLLQMKRDEEDRTAVEQTVDRWRRQHR